MDYRDQRVSINLKLSHVVIPQKSFQHTAAPVVDTEVCAHCEVPASQ